MSVQQVRSTANDVTHLRNVRQHFLQRVPVEVRLLRGVLHVDDVEELQRVHGRIAATKGRTLRTARTRLRRQHPPATVTVY